MFLNKLCELAHGESPIAEWLQPVSGGRGLTDTEESVYDIKTLQYSPIHFFIFRTLTDTLLVWAPFERTSLRAGSLVWTGYRGSLSPLTVMPIQTSKPARRLRENWTRAQNERLHR